MDAMFEMLYGMGVIPVIRIDDPEDAVPLCRALLRGGLPVAEITFLTEAAAESLRRAGQDLPDMLVGAGTVTSLELARQALEAGAKFIVTPGFNPEVVGWCLERGIPVLPGCTTASEVEAAQNLGLSVVKFFPAEQSGGLARIKALGGPYPRMRFIPTGGVNLDNLAVYLASDRVWACGGSFMVSEPLLREKAWDKVAAVTSRALNAVLGLELDRVGVPAGPDEDARELGKMFAALTGQAVSDAGDSLLVGTGVEVLKRALPGKGELVFRTCSLQRARYQLGRRGVIFDEASAVRTADGTLRSICLADRPGGFSVRLTAGRR